jgi:alkenylglycerophosphocholine/alkenylglycerophosphoethanolamine hydrolase
MTRVRTLASLGVAAATLAYLVASSQGWTAAGYATKPLIVVSCLGIVAGGAASPTRGWILAGLGLSLGGDIALMLPGDYFVAGLALFLVAHLCYIRAFTLNGWRVSPLPSLLVGGYLMLMVALLVPVLGPMRVPVAVYATVISIMAWQAVEQRAALETRAAALVAFGAVMFVASDTALAINRFLTPLAMERLLIMGTYALAQWAIALGASMQEHGRPVA